MHPVRTVKPNSGVTAIFALFAVTLAVITFAAVDRITHPQDSWSWQCQHRHGVVVDDECIDRRAVITIP